MPKKPLECILNLTIDDEHPIAIHTAFNEYLETFEGMIEGFIEGKGYNVQDFYRHCKDILANDEDLLNSDRIFIETVIKE